MLVQCVSAELLDRLHAGELPEAEEKAVRAHLQSCMPCARKEAELLRAHERLLHEVRVLHGSGLLRAAAAPPEVSSSAPPAQVDRPTIVPNIAGYRIVEEISRGGQGVVYRAVQESTRREVAIKVLRDGAFASATAKARFQREIELAAGLRHRHIITIFDSGVTSDGMQYCVMDYVRGLPLLRHVTEHDLSIEAALNLFVLVCEAVETAHAHDILHRDLKPSNILVDLDGQPRVLDFGLARVLADPRQTLMSGSLEMVGTLPYMAPEQAAERGERVDRRTDVYALGVILYEMLTGRSPYPVQGRLTDVLRHICETPPLPLRRAWSAPLGMPGGSVSRRSAGRCPLDSDIETIVGKALAKEPARRYATAGELAADLRRYVSGEAIAARPASAVYRARKFVRRRRVVLGLSALAALAVVAAGATVYFQSAAGRAEAAQQREEAQRLYFEAQVEAYRDPKNAVAMYERAIECDPTFLEAQIRRAYLLWREIGGKEATQAAEAILVNHPDCGEAHLLLEQTHRYSDPQRAAHHRTEGGRLLPNDLYYRAAALDMAHSAEAVELLTKLLAVDGANFDARADRALRQIALGRAEAALADAEVLKAIGPTSPIGWDLGAGALGRLRRFEETVQWLDEALRLRPNRPSSILHRAQALAALRRYDEALADCNRAIELTPTAALAYAVRAKVRFARGNGAAILDDVEQALLLDPSNGVAHHSRGKVLYAQQRFDEAVESLRLAIESDPTLADAQADLGDALRQLGHADEAVKHYSAALELAPTLAQAIEGRALAFELLGDYERAISDYDRVIELNPKSVFAIGGRGYARLELGQPSAALEDFARAEELAPRDRSLSVHRGLALWLLDDLSGAISSFDRAVAISPEGIYSAYFWLWELRARRGESGDDAAAAEILSRAERLPLATGYANLLRHCRGELSDEELIAAAQTPDHQCDACFHLAAHAGIAGDRTSERAWLERASAACPSHTYEHTIARHRLHQSDDRLAGHPSGR